MTVTAPVGAPTSIVTRSWYQPETISDDAQVRLFLFPHAGSGAVIYRDWADLLPSSIGEQAVTLPGRHHRRDEPTYYEWDALLEAALDAVANEVDDRPFVFFGHCLGAQIAFNLAVRFEEEGLTPPSLVGVSGWSPIGFYKPTVDQAEMSEAEIVQWIKHLGSFPAEVYENPEMLAMVIPALRADLGIGAQYEDDGKGVSVPLVSYGGKDDPLQREPDAMSHWADRTPEYLGHSEYPGGHFYIDKHALSVTTDLARHIDRYAIDV